MPIYSTVSGESNRNRVNLSDTLVTDSGDSLVGAAVTVLRDGVPIDRYVETDVTGRFLVEDLPNGTYTVIARSENNTATINVDYSEFTDLTSINPSTGSVDNCEVLPASAGMPVDAVFRTDLDKIWFTGGEEMGSLVNGTLFFSEYSNIHSIPGTNTTFPGPASADYLTLYGLAPGQTWHAPWPSYWPSTPNTATSPAPSSTLYIDPFEYYMSMNDQRFYHYVTGVAAPDSFYDDPWDPATAHIPKTWWFDSTVGQWAWSNEFGIGELPKHGDHAIYKDAMWHSDGVPGQVISDFGTNIPGTSSTVSYLSDGYSSIPVTNIYEEATCRAMNFEVPIAGLIPQEDFTTGGSALLDHGEHLFSGGVSDHEDSQLSYTAEIEKNIKLVFSILDVNEIPATSRDWLVKKYIITPRLAQLKAHFSIGDAEAEEALFREASFGKQLSAAADNNYNSIALLIRNIVSRGLSKEYFPPVSNLDGLLARVAVDENGYASLIDNESLPDCPKKLARDLLDTAGTSEFAANLATWTDKLQRCVTYGKGKE